MINATIKEGHGGFYNQYGEKKFVLLEEGQALTIERQEADQYICSVVNPSDESKNYGVIDGVFFWAYKEDLEIVNMASVLFNGMHEEADQS